MRLRHDLAHKLREHSTDAERLLWQRLRNRQLLKCKFRRQQPIGPYIVDFVCLERRLVIELDGGQHAEQISQDETRTAFLQAEGYRVLRYWNNQVLAELESVLDAILSCLADRATPHPTLAPGSPLAAGSPLPGGPVAAGKGRGP
jgi:very-short-patch-repair endonuclease